MTMEVRCPMCGSFAVRGTCNGCNLPFCENHLFRHRQCKEGR